MRRVLLSASLFFSSACSSTSEDAPAAASEALLEVENASPVWSGEEGWTVSSEPLLTLGTGFSHGDAAFSTIHSALRLESGEIVVADGPPSRVAVFSPEGAYLHSLGRRGEGPGEYQDACCLTLFQDSLVAVYDTRLARLTLFASTGAYVASGPVGRRERDLFSAPVGSYGESSLVLKEVPLPRPQERGVVFRDTTRLLLNALRVDGDRLTSERVEEIAAVPGPEMFSDNPPRASEIPFGRRGVFAASRFWIAHASGDGWAFILQGAQGSRRRISRVWDPKPVTRTEWESSREQLIAGAQGGGQGPTPPPGVVRGFYEDLFSRMPKPDHHPPFRALLIDASDHVWAQQGDPEHPGSWSVFEAGGRYLGDVRMPAGFTPVQVGRDWVLGLAESADGAPLLELRQLQDPPQHVGSLGQDGLFQPGSVSHPGIQ